MLQFGKAEDQAHDGCEQIAGIPELAGGVSLPHLHYETCGRRYGLVYTTTGLAEIADDNQFDAMGFSQGGLYLRSYAQNCNDPPVRNLMTVRPPSPLYGCI